MTTIVIAVAAAVMAMLVVSIVAVSTTFAITDNNNTDARAEAVENDSSSVVERHSGCRMAMQLNTQLGFFFPFYANCIRLRIYRNPFIFSISC
jgi:hypothetical protein